MNDQPPPRPTIGKGDTQRPFVGDRYRDNYEDIFRKPRQQQYEVECPTPNQEIDEKETND
jgi:hypothetical protein